MADDASSGSWPAIIRDQYARARGRGFVAEGWLLATVSLTSMSAWRRETVPPMAHGRRSGSWPTQRLLADDTSSGSCIGESDLDVRL